MLPISRVFVLSERGDTVVNKTCKDSLSYLIVSGKNRERVDVAGSHTHKTMLLDDTDVMCCSCDCHVME